MHARNRSPVLPPGSTPPYPGVLAGAPAFPREGRSRRPHMHLARRVQPVILCLAVLAFSLTTAASQSQAASRLPLVGTNPTPITGGTRASSELGLIVSVDPSTVPCASISTFEDVDGGESPGTNYDGLLWSGGVEFAERFAGQTVSSNGDFDQISGNPTSPLILQPGAPGQNLDVFTYSSNVLTGLGHIG